MKEREGDEEFCNEAPGQSTLQCPCAGKMAEGGGFSSSNLCAD